MQNSITIEVAESRAKKLSGRLLTIKLAAEKLKFYESEEKPDSMIARVEALSKIEDKEFEGKFTKEIWE